MAAAALAIFGLGYLLLAHSTHLGPGMAAALVGHIGVGACAILALNGLQLTTPDHIRGRVMVFVFSLSSALQGVSTLAVAPMAATIGMTDTTRLLGAFAVFYAIIWSIGSSRIRAERLDAPHKGTFEA